MIKNVMLFLLLTLLAACAPGFKAVENDGPNAGDDVAGEFVVIANQVVETMKRIDGVQGMNAAEYSKLRDQFASAVRETKVESRERVYDSSGERSAVNYPDRKVILVSRTHWTVEPTEPGRRLRLVIHEYLGILGEPDTGWSRSDAILNEIRGFLDPVIIGAHTIATCQELDSKLRFANEDDMFVLVRDIDCAETATWNDGFGFKPITFFEGQLDGRGHKVLGLTITRSGSEAAPSRSVAPIIYLTGTIRNVTFENSSIHSNRATSGLVGKNEGKIENVHITGEVSGSSVGGLVVANYGAVTRSSANVRLTVIGNEVASTAGGLVAINHGYVEDGRAQGQIRGTWSVGGLVGHNYHLVAGANCEVIDARIKAVTNAGGLVGKNEGGNVRGCTVTRGRVSSENWAGGLVGYNVGHGRIEQNKFGGRVCGSRDLQAIVGYDIDPNRSLSGGNISQGYVSPCD